MIGLGSVSIRVLTDEVMMDRSSVCIPLLEKRMRMMMMSPREMKPPVAVLYYDYLLYFINWFVENRSIFFRPDLIRRPILRKSIRINY